ncbi:IDEAL domain-containing protein [Chengkuizengella sp. SCS-71B]|uniref:IDEAL domain-containing protein n=1 Tax=Chengkuizengella sp. SCS-71B TaxID=3115290 RepID=UPI0032C2175C
MKLFKVGDWVKGVSKEDEFFIGYVERVKDTLVNIYIVQSDNPHLINRKVKTSTNKITAMEPSDMYFEGNILNLIDIALIEKNEDDFLKYTNQLHELRSIHEKMNNLEEINFTRGEGSHRI